MSKIRRLTFGLMAISLLAVGLFGATSIANPGTAEARCDGRDREIVSDFIVWTVTLVQEFPQTDTCNGNHSYNGVVVDTYEDEGQVAVMVQDYEGSPWRFVYLEAPPVGQWNLYDFGDQNRNSHVNMRLCSNTGIGLPLTCGWGGVVGGHGDNHGF